jgi:hypothetical protein
MAIIKQHVGQHLSQQVGNKAWTRIRNKKSDYVLNEIPNF